MGLGAAGHKIGKPQGRAMFVRQHSNSFKQTTFKSDGHLIRSAGTARGTVVHR